MLALIVFKQLVFPYIDELLVLGVLEVFLPPCLPVKVLDLLKLLEVVEFVLEPPVPLPSHHPDMPPFVPESLGPGILDAALALTHAGPGSLPVGESWSISAWSLPGSGAGSAK